MTDTNPREMVRGFAEPVRPNRSGVLVLSGWGLSVRVRRRRLVLADGLGPRRREGEFFRASSPIKRLVLVGRAGSITLEGVAWLHDTGASLIHLDWDGTVLLSSSAWGSNDGRLRRQQALAPASGTGISIARRLITDKLFGQLTLLQQRAEATESTTTVEQALARVDACETPAELMRVEAEAAAAYWAALGPTPLTFARRDLSKVPEHWLTLGQRSSPITRSPRRAATPGQALINLAYGAATAEATIACTTLGLDPALGVLHADVKARDSMALDLLEPCRPAVDRNILALLASHTFTARDFREDRQGQVWVTPTIARQIAQTCQLWARELAPIAEQVAKSLAATNPRLSVPTLLTQEARSRGRDPVRRGPRTQSRPRRPALPRVCRECGTILNGGKRGYCEACLPAFRTGQKAEFSAAGPVALARLRADGRDPAHGGDAAKHRSETMRRRHREAAAWGGRANESDPVQFARDVLPAIQGIPLRRLAQATGLSLRYCALIRRGARVPHQRHWPAIRQAAAQSSALESPE